MKLIRYAFALVYILPLISAVPAPDMGNINNVNAGSHLSFLFPLPINDNSSLYADWNLSPSGLAKESFDEAIKGYHYLLQKNLISRSEIITIVDYSKPSTQKRLFILDMKNGKILFNTLVAHGRNSGANYASDFSNEEESHMSSLGFYITLNTYTGANGYSLKLKGCEKGINDNAGSRAIVLHGAEYVSEKFIHTKGYLGRSFGCPAVPMELHKKIIDQIKNGSCVFLYHPTKKYASRSKILGS